LQATGAAGLPEHNGTGSDAGWGEADVLGIPGRVLILGAAVAAVLSFASPYIGAVRRSSAW